MDLKGDVQHALPLAQPKLLKGIQLYFAELDVQSMVSLPVASDEDICAHKCKACLGSCKWVPT